MYYFITLSNYTQDKNTLEKCDLVLRTNRKYSGDFSLETQRDLFAAAESCIERNLCYQLHEVTRDDVLRAGLEEYDFGENAVFANLISETYSNIQFEKKKTRLTRSVDLPVGDSEAQSSLNTLADFLLVDMVSSISSNNLGRIKLPDHKIDLGATFFSWARHFKITDGSLGDLTKVLRTQDVRLTNDGLRFTLSIGLRLPNVQIYYKNYDVKNTWVTRSGSATIGVASIALSAKIAVNYNTFPCKVSADYIDLEIEKPTIELSGGNWFKKLLAEDATNSATTKFTNYIVAFLKKFLRDKVTEALGTLDCEKFRPRVD